MAVGIDIGGTNIKAGIVDEDGNVRFAETVPTVAKDGRESLLFRLEEIAARSKRLAEGEGWSVRALGVGTAGYVNVREGRINFATSNLPGWTGVPLQSELERRTGLPVALANDAHAFAIGEAWIGAGRAWSEFVCVTLGTGVGGCYVADGQPKYGRDGYAGGFGHQVVAYRGQPCNCGLTGCWEQYASVTALLRLAAEGGIPPELIGGSAKQLFELARNGDAKALAVIDLYAEYVAVGLTNLVHALNPHGIVIGGAVTAQGDFLFDRIRAELARQLMPAFGFVAVVPAALGEHAGIVGAARLALVGHRQ